MILFIAGWLLTGVVAYGLILGTFTNRFPYFSNTGVAVIVGLAGYVGLIASGFFVLISGPAKFRLKPLSKEEAWQAHKARWSTLTRNDFERSY